MICLGIEGTAEKTGIGIVDSNGDILATCGDQLYPEVGGIHPRDAANFHAEHIVPLIGEALNESNLELSDIDLVSFAKGPGLGPALRTIATAARSLSQQIDVPLVGVNHCIGHIEIGKLTTDATNPLTLYASGGNTQIISYEASRYRIIGETLDIAIGNCLDQFSRDVGLGHPGGPVVEAHARNTDEVVELPYVVKGMDLSFSGILTSAISKYKKGVDLDVICNSFQETCFSMLCEITERAISYTNKSEVLLCGGVAANNKLREMLQVMCEEHYVDFYMPEMKYCGDNGSMIAQLGLLTYLNNGKTGIENSYINPKYRTDQVDVTWIDKNINKPIELPENIAYKGAEADIIEASWDKSPAIIKKRLKKNYRKDSIDNKLRIERTKKEAKLISDSKKAQIRTPYIYSIDLDNYELVLEKIEAPDLHSIIEDNSIEYLEELFELIGKKVALMHESGIIHGDLTTSNILLMDETPVFIDFGLGRYSSLDEDFGVDLLVFKKSLSTIIPENSDKLFQSFLDGYDNEKIVNKIDEIESRGRYL